MIRELLVPMLRQPGDETALAFAIALAQRHQAHLAALVTIASPMPLATEWGYVPAEVNQQATEAARAEGEALAGRLRVQLDGAEVASEVRLADSVLMWPEDTLALHASHADLTVLAGHDPELPGARFSLSFKALLMRSGRPVLVVPRQCTARPIRRAVIAWQPTPESARAVHDALPLLADAETVTIVMIDPVSSEGGYGDPPGSAIARHLSRHGLTIEVLALPRQGRSVGDCLLGHLRDCDADLLVMGGYGHSRWREAILGGTTRTVLDGMATPVLFAH